MPVSSIMYWAPVEKAERVWKSICLVDEFLTMRQLVARLWHAATELCAVRRWFIAVMPSGDTATKKQREKVARSHTGLKVRRNASRSWFAASWSTYNRSRLYELERTCKALEEL